MGMLIKPLIGGQQLSKLHYRFFSVAMPASNFRKITHHHIANEAIPADQFIPRFLDAKAKEIVKNAGNVGLRGFLPDKYSIFNPYLSLSDITVGPPLMFPDHPHSGHEMMLYVLDGEFVHEDFLGVTETFKVGDLHWMTTGKGIIHAQVPGKQKHNRHIQFWINLPKDKQNIEPGNQVLRASKMPTITGDGYELKVLVGSYQGKTAAITVQSPLVMMDIAVKGGSKCLLQFAPKTAIGFYVINGKGTIAEEEVKLGSILMSKCENENERDATVSVQAEEDMRIILFGGMPLSDPMDYDGFFISCSKKETEKAVSDFEKCSDSFSLGKNWRSAIANKRS
jgi:redox-sensitive bicupin YhaK (pirin superfamily)